jgi:hypothetical protein
MSENENAEPRRSSAPLWVIIGLCATPMIAAYIAYYVWPPAGHVNYGELIEPTTLPEVELAAIDGRRVRVSDFKGDWLMVVVDDAACAESCQRKLLYTRQVRLAQGTQKDRVERLWILTGAGRPDEALLKEHPELTVAMDASGALVKSLPAARAPADHVYVVDPLGNLMLRFPADPDPRRMLKDMSRLLRHSKWK